MSCKFFQLSHRLLALGYKAVKWSILFAFIALSAMLAIDTVTGYMVKDKIYTDIEQLPKRHTALVLGTAKFFTKGVPNLYYQYRLEAAEQLLHQGKVQELLLSGDNQTPFYNEPKAMQKDMLMLGLPLKSLKQDFAGYKTLDSVVRAKEVFKIEPFTIVTQQFHCERALFIAKMRNIDAICFAAQYPEGYLKVRIRELLARPLMLWNELLKTPPQSLEDVPSK